MATFGDKKHVIKVTMTPADSASNGLGAVYYEDSGTTDVTASLYTEFTITKATADTTVSLGNIGGFKHVVIMGSEGFDNVYFSTVGGAKLSGVGGDFVFAMNLSAEIAALHIDCTGSAANVDVKILLLSEA